MTHPSYRSAHKGAHVAGVAALCVALLFADLAWPDVERLTLYQKTARSALVVRARCLSSSTRKPQVRVLETIKGSAPAETLTIIPHFEDNTSPTPWLQREVFKQGEESILFLEPYRDEFGRDEGPATFSALGANQGKMEVPTEGAEALLEALRRFSEILAMGQLDRQATALRGFFREKNPFLVEAALEECARFRLAAPEDVPPLVDLLKSPRPEFRAGSLRLLGQLVAEGLRGAADGPELPPDAQLFETAAAVIRFDEEATVRRSAVTVLEALGGGAAQTLLEEIGRMDSSQMVRYDAQVAAHRLRQAVRQGAGKPPR